jgi:hypothetical protein
MPSQTSLVTGSRTRVSTAKFATVGVCHPDRLLWTSLLATATSGACPRSSNRYRILSVAVSRHYRY